MHSVSDSILANRAKIVLMSRDFFLSDKIIALIRENFKLNPVYPEGIFEFEISANGCDIIAKEPDSNGSIVARLDDEQIKEILKCF